MSEDNTGSDSEAVAVDGEAVAGSGSGEKKLVVSARYATFVAAIDAKVGSNPSPEMQLAAAKARALGYGYDLKWQSAPYSTVAVEQFFHTRLSNPDTDHYARNLSIAGVVDLLTERPGFNGTKRCLFDHKTTSQDIDSPDAPYWRQLAIEGQVSHYALLLYLHGITIDEIVWDVIRKPSIAPKKLSKAEVRSVVANQDYFGRRMSMSSITDVATKERETTELYEARLAWDCTRERPGWYYQRRNVPRLQEELAEYAYELWAHGQDLLAERKRLAKSKRLPPRNYKSCMAYGTACRFLGICSGYDNPDSPKWARKTCVHGELKLPNDGRNVLTTSRISCFQVCRRKHYYEYELGIRRVDGEESDALVFGSLMHAGLNAWWQANGGNDVSSTTANNTSSQQPADQATYAW